MRPQQVSRQRNAEEPNYVSRDQACADGKTAADERTFDRAAQCAVARAPAGEGRRWLPGVQSKSLR